MIELSSGNGNPHLTHWCPCGAQGIVVLLGDGKGSMALCFSLNPGSSCSTARDRVLGFRIGMTQKGCKLPPWESTPFADGRIWGSVMLEVKELSQYVALPAASGICVRSLKPVFLSLPKHASS